MTRLGDGGTSQIPACSAADADTAVATPFPGLFLRKIFRGDELGLDQTGGAPASAKLACFVRIRGARDRMRH